MLRAVALNKGLNGLRARAARCSLQGRRSAVRGPLRAEVLRALVWCVLSFEPLGQQRAEVCRIAIAVS